MAKTKIYQDMIGFSSIKLFIGDKIVEVQDFELKLEEGIGCSLFDLINILTCDISGKVGMKVGPVCGFLPCGEDRGVFHVRTLYAKSGKQETYAEAEFKMAMYSQEAE